VGPDRPVRTGRPWRRAGARPGRIPLPGQHNSGRHRASLGAGAAGSGREHHPAAARRQRSAGAVRSASGNRYLTDR